MKSSKEEMQYSIGAYLKSQREKKGFSLQEIHEKTRIRPEVLKNIETGENLPAPAYLVGFLKTYARALDLDEAKLLRDFYKKKPKKNLLRKKTHLMNLLLFLQEKEFFSLFLLSYLCLLPFFSLRVWK